MMMENNKTVKITKPGVVRVIDKSKLKELQDKGWKIKVEKPKNEENPENE